MCIRRLPTVLYERLQLSYSHLNRLFSPGSDSVVSFVTATISCGCDIGRSSCKSKLLGVMLLMKLQKMTVLYKNFTQLQEELDIMALCSRSLSLRLNFATSPDIFIKIFKRLK